MVVLLPIFLISTGAESICPTATQILAGWNRAAEYSAGLKTPLSSVDYFRTTYAQLIESFSIEELSARRDAGRLNFLDYFRGGPDLFAFGMHINGSRDFYPNAIDFPGLIDNVISNRIRQLAQSNRSEVGLVETGRVENWLPASLGGKTEPSKASRDYFNVVTTIIPLPDGRMLYAGASNIPYQSGVSEFGRILIVSEKGRQPKATFEDFQVIDAADISPSGENIAIVGLSLNGPMLSRISIVTMKGLNQLPKASLDLATEPIAVTFVTDTTVMAIFENEIISYSLEKGELKPIMKESFPSKWKATAVAHSADKAKIFVGFENGSRLVVHNDTGRLEFLAENRDLPSGLRHTGAIKQIGVDADGTAYFLSDKDGVISQWHQ